MTRSDRLPVMRLWTPRKLAYIHIFGRRHYLGPWGSKEADAAYRLAVRDLLGITHTGPIEARAPRKIIYDVVTAADLANAYAAYSVLQFVKRGRPTGTAANASRVRDLIVQSAFGRAQLDSCDALWLRDLRTHIAAATRDTSTRPPTSITRGTLNEYVAIVVRMFRFGAENGLCDATLWHTLKVLQPIKRGRPPEPNGKPLPEGKPVQPVPRPWIQRIRRHLGRTVRIMLDVQLLTGMRPNELCYLRPADLSPTKSPGVMLYTVSADANKTDHEEDALPRLVWLGPRALRLLSMLPKPATPATFYFSPAIAAAEFDARRSASRSIKLYPSHDLDIRRGRRRAAGKAPRIDGDRYTPDSYRRAIERACERASRGGRPLRFTPYQLRHNCATEIANREQIQVAQVMLGHKSISTTARYVKPWAKSAVAAALKYG